MNIENASELRAWIWRTFDGVYNESDTIEITTEIIKVLEEIRNHE